MSITLAHLDLPPGLHWVDEFDVQAVSQAVRRRLDGGITVYPRGNTLGRAITLETAEDHWIARATGEALLLLAATPGLSMTLALRGTVHQVVFRHHDPPALELRPLVAFSDPRGDDPLVGRLKLMTV